MSAYSTTDTSKLRPNDHKSLILESLQRMKGDDLYRARAAFKGLTPEQMKEQHGYSGLTRQEILDGYEAHEARVDAAINWVKSIV